MSTATDHVWHCYQQTQFLLTQPLSPVLSFAIVTAHNPRGETLSAPQNRLLDRQLQLRIETLKHPYRSLVGSSLDLSHMEKSWAIPMDKRDAVELAKEFHQNAIYYIQQDQLQLVPCLLSYPELSLGHFSARVHVVSELPDLCA
ncbi:DUF3293 domain-containing protein [Shewanella sp. Isolate11]|uniref:DUF3293 domain-containing protein n=1 Tax=Shewanella sp. Isolate11 TaxID=2908530 RepID=UPI001EFCD575|nr:DUF3293 domain-containing protein [Shewanella sp. Isolate11]MCG9697622.1 DUF3293 domain-containing protein [Shewanella sp. Isolate11]